MSHSVRPKDLPEAFGCLWPDGAPSKPPTIDKVVRTDYNEEDGQGFTIAYTDEQVMSQVGDVGMFRPYIPLYVTDVLKPPMDARKIVYVAGRICEAWSKETIEHDNLAELLIAIKVAKWHVEQNNRQRCSRDPDHYTGDLKYMFKDEPVLPELVADMEEGV